MQFYSRKDERGFYFSNLNCIDKNKKIIIRLLSFLDERDQKYAQQVCGVNA